MNLNLHIHALVMDGVFVSDGTQLRFWPAPPPTDRYDDESTGWCTSQGPLTLGYAAILTALFDLKASREERSLVERCPEYAAYKERVRKLIPLP